MVRSRHPVVEQTTAKQPDQSLKVPLTEVPLDPSCHRLGTRASAECSYSVARSWLKWQPSKNGNQTRHGKCHWGCRLSARWTAASFARHELEDQADTGIASISNSRILGGRLVPSWTEREACWQDKARFIPQQLSSRAYTASPRTSMTSPMNGCRTDAWTHNGKSRSGRQDISHEGNAQSR